MKIRHNRLTEVVWLLVVKVLTILRHDRLKLRKQLRLLPLTIGVLVEAAPYHSLPYNVHPIIASHRAHPPHAALGKLKSVPDSVYFLDSHGYPNGVQYPDVESTYDWIKPDQIAYYKEMAIANRNATPTASPTNQSSVLPAVMFFHIPIPEYASVGSSKFRSGDKNEKVETSEIQSNLFSALVEMGDVKATFVGHDHVNEYCYKRQGVQLCYGGGTGFAQAYGSAQFARRSRVIEWSVDARNRRWIKSWKRHYGSAFDTRQHEEILYEETPRDETL